MIRTFSNIWDSLSQLASAQPPYSPPAPSLVEGTELIGEYKDSGLREAPWLVRRADGRVVQVSRLLYAVAESLDGAADLGSAAARAAAATGRSVSAENVHFLVENKLRPLGIVAGEGAAAPAPVAAAPLQLALRVRLIPTPVVNAAAWVLKPLFGPMIVGAVLALVVVGDGWLFLRHGLGLAVRDVLIRPELMVAVFGLVLASIVFHELGHAAACRFGGARPGVIGAGLYLVYPALYTDVTDAYRLDRRGRVRTDLGGIYFNLVFALGLFGVYYATRFEPLLVVVAIEHALVFNQFWPWLRLDGYYVLNDLTGVPDVMSHVKPLLRSLVPGRTPCPRVAELKPRVRWILTIYAVALVPMLALMLALLAWATPHIVGTAWRVLHVEYRVFVHEAARADAGGATVAAARALLLALPACGILLGLSRMLLRLLDAAARRLGVTAPLRPKLGALLRPAVVFIAGFAAAGALASAWHESRTGVRTAAGAQLRDSRGRHTTRNNVRPAAASARISSAPRRPTWSTNATTAGVAASAPRPRGTTTARRAAVPKPPGTTSTTGSTSTTGTTGTTTTDTTSTTDTTTTDTTSSTGTTPTTTTTTTPTTTTGG